MIPGTYFVLHTPRISCHEMDINRACATDMGDRQGFSIGSLHAEKLRRLCVTCHK